MGLRAGELDQRVTFQRATTVADTQGGRSQTWAAIAGLSNVAAQIEWASAQESAQADQLVAQRRGTVKTRYASSIAGVTEKDRMTWNGRTLAILGILPGGMRLSEWLEFSVVERAS